MNEIWKKEEETPAPFGKSIIIRTESGGFSVSRKMTDAANRVSFSCFPNIKYSPKKITHWIELPEFKL